MVVFLHVCVFVFVCLVFMFDWLVSLSLSVLCAEDAKTLLKAGADKVAINTAAVREPALLKELSTYCGSNCVVIAIDAVQIWSEPPEWEVVISAGKEKTGIDVVEWARTAVQMGAGEILLTSFDRDGTKSGYDLKLLRAVSSAVNVPVIASGGASKAEHMVEALKAGADAVLAASIFHYGEVSVDDLKVGSLVFQSGLVAAGEALVRDSLPRLCVVFSLLCLCILSLTLSFFFFSFLPLFCLFFFSAFSERASRFVCRRVGTKCVIHGRPSASTRQRSV
jgi:Histidine biosynthesis protein